MDRDQDSKYTLQIENYKMGVRKYLKKYWERKRFIDVTLICDGESSLVAHQVVLSACSKFFENILLTHRSPHPIIFVDIPKDHMQLLLKFMYEGEISVSKEQFPSLLKTATKLQIQGMNYKEFDNGQTHLVEIKDTKNDSSVEQNSTIGD